jgi:hypothetical protein
MVNGSSLGALRGSALRWRTVWRALLRRALYIPSGGVSARQGRRVRLVGLLAARDEMRFLPGYFANLVPHVDAVVALDDGSTDGSTEFLASQPAVVELIRRAPQRPSWDEVGNFRDLHAAGVRQRADWLLWLDADERLERGFRERAERIIRRGGRLGLIAFAVRIRELWDSPNTFRRDGVWGRKWHARLFRALPDHLFDTRRLHATRAPLQGRVLGGFPRADLTVYHLRMVRREDREARRDRYMAMDPEARFQPGLGYAYLTDESGIRLARVPRRRGFVE